MYPRRLGAWRWEAVPSLRPVNTERAEIRSGYAAFDERNQPREENRHQVLGSGTQVTRLYEEGSLALRLTSLSGRTPTFGSPLSRPAVLITSRFVCDSCSFHHDSSAKLALAYQTLESPLKAPTGLHSHLSSIVLTRLSHSASLLPCSSIRTNVMSVWKTCSSSDASMSRR